MKTTSFSILLTFYFIIAVFTINAQSENGLHFDGLNDNISLAPSTHSQIQSSGTIEAWIKTSYDNSSYRGLVLRSNQYGIFLYNNKLATYVWGGNSPGLICPSGPFLNDGQWHHVALTFEIGVSNGAQLYLDGAPLGNAFTLQTFQSTISYGFQIGSNTNLQYYKGAMDEVKLWSRKLSAQEIDNTTNCLSNSSTNLNGHYKFNVGTANGTNSGLTTLADSSGSNNNGTLNYFSLSGSNSNWVSGYTCPCFTPTGDANQTFCQGSTIEDLAASGQQIQWYENATGGSAIVNTTSLIDNTTYYATQTAGGCESVNRLPVTVSISGPRPAAPTGASQQYFCVNMYSTVAELQAVGTDIKWYSNPSPGTFVDANQLIDQQFYYATQTVDGCESNTYLSVYAFVTAEPTPPLYVNSNQSFCSGATISDLTGSYQLNWYLNPTGGSALPNNTALINNNYYFASKIYLGCESMMRVPVNVKVGSIDLSVTINGYLITANQNDASYKWIDCNNNNQAILNETNQSYNALNDGSYAVIISLPNCTDTSACISDIALINELEKSTITINPNPVIDILVIDGEFDEGAQITSFEGKLIETIELNGKTNLNVSNYPSGVYFLRTSSGKIKQFIKE